MVYKNIDLIQQIWVTLIVQNTLICKPLGK